MFTIVKLSFADVAKAYNITVEEARISAMKMGGFCALNLTEEAMATQIQEFGEAAVKKIFTKGLGNYIMVSTSFIEIANLTEFEVGAILAHEEGHVVHEHLTSSEASKAIKMGKTLCVQDFELEADRYAAERFGKEVMHSALSKVIYAVATAASEIDEDKKGCTDHFNKVHSLMLGSIKYRLDALSA